MANNDSRYYSRLFRFETFVKLPLYAAILIIISLLLYRILLIYSYNGEVGGFDNNFVYDVLRGLNGLPIYTDPSKPPYAITLYTPLYYNLCITAGKLIHVNTEDPIYIYQLCRYISFLCDAVSCLLLYRILRSQFRIQKDISLFSVAGFACIICHLGYTFSRSDSIFLSFYAAFIYLLITKKNQNKILFLFLLALLANACIFSKQNGIIVPVLAIVWLIIKKETKSALLYVLFFFAIMAAAIAIYIYIFNYKYLFENTVKALYNRTDLAWFYSDIFKRSLNSLWILPLYAACVIALQHWLRPKSIDDKSLAALFFIQLAFSLATSLKWGSSAGYFNECFLLGFILISRKIANPVVGFPPNYTQKIIYSLTPLLILFAIHTNAQGYLFFLQNRDKKISLYQQQKEVRNYLRPKLQGHYVADLTSPGTSFFKTLFYKEIMVPNYDMVSCCTFPDNTFNYSSLKQNVSNGVIQYLILPDTRSPNKLWGVSLQQFQRDTTISNYVIYRYNVFTK